MSTQPTEHEVNEVLNRLNQSNSTHWQKGTAIDPNYDFNAAPVHLRRIAYNGMVWFCYRRWWTRLFWWRR